MSLKKLPQLEKKIKITFNDKKLLERAVRHRSYLNEHRHKDLKSNERLEFLGDAVLELWTTRELFERFAQLTEGVMTNIRAAIVRTESLAEAAKKINLGEYLFLSKGENAGGGRENQSILADTFEALTGAIFLDQGWVKTAKFLEKNLLDKLISLGKNGDVKDAKTILQEKIQAELKLTPHYQIIQETGPDHDKEFTVAVYFGKKEIAKAKGKSKREAEEKAAGLALTQD